MGRISFLDSPQDPLEEGEMGRWKVSQQNTINDAPPAAEVEAPFSVQPSLLICASDASDGGNE